MLLALIAAITTTSVKANAIELSTSKFGAQYGYLRHLMTAPSADAQYVDAVTALNALTAKFPDKITLRSGKTYDVKDVGEARLQELYWRSIDVLAYSSIDLAMLRSLPNRLQKPIGGFLPIKDAVEIVEKAMTLSQKPWEASWEKYRLDIKSQQQVWQNVYGIRADRDLRDIAKKLAFSKVPDRVEIVMLPFTGGKEGMTLQTMDGWKVVIGSQTHQSSAFAEVVLHEATHVMDLVSGEDSFLARLRKALVEAKRPDQEVEQVPHVLIFLAAAAQIQSREPGHKPVGEVTGAFGRLPKKLVDAARSGFAQLPDEPAAIKAILDALN